MRANDDLLALVGLALGRRAVPAAALELLEPTLGHGQVGEHELEVELLEVAAGSTLPAGCGWAGSSKARTTWSSASAVAQAGEVVGRQLLGADAALGRGRRRGQVDVGHVGRGRSSWA